MTNLERLKKKRKTLNIINWICRITVWPFLILMGVLAPQSTILATIMLVLFLITLITGLILDKTLKRINEDIRDIRVIKEGIEDSRN